MKNFKDVQNRNLMWLTTAAVGSLFGLSVILTVANWNAEDVSDRAGSLAANVITGVVTIALGVNAATMEIGEAPIPQFDEEELTA